MWREEADPFCLGAALNSDASSPSERSSLTFSWHRRTKAAEKALEAAQEPSKMLTARQAQPSPPPSLRQLKASPPTMWRASKGDASADAGSSAAFVDAYGACKPGSVMVRPLPNSRVLTNKTGQRQISPLPAERYRLHAWSTASPRAAVGTQGARASWPMPSRGCHTERGLPVPVPSPDPSYRVLRASASSVVVFPQSHLGGRGVFFAEGAGQRCCVR